MTRAYHPERMAGVGLAVVFLSVAGCRSPMAYRSEADRVADRVINATQTRALGKTEAIRVDSPAETLRRRLLLDQKLAHSGPASLGVHDLPESEHWEKDKHAAKAQEGDAAKDASAVLRLSLLDALQISAGSSREYQAAKESLYRAALALDLERNEFRSTFSGMLSAEVAQDGSGEETVTVETESAQLGVGWKFVNGIELSSRILVDMVKLLTQDMSSALGLSADASISIPLLRGSGRDIAGEPLKQAEQNMLYEVYAFERFKRTFAVRTAREYLGVLQAQRQVRNVEENYKRLVASGRRARRLADSGRLPEFQFDQAVQDELRARTRWIGAMQSYASRLDAFKNLLGLPPDANMELDVAELERLQAVVNRFSVDDTVTLHGGDVPAADALVRLERPDRRRAGPLELDAEEAVRLALRSRLDLRIVEGRVDDAQRRVRVAADQLRPEVTLLGSARVGGRRNSAGTATEEDSKLDFDRGAFSGLLTVDLGLERTAERNEYRSSLMDLEESVRDAQEKEDTIKLEIRDTLRELVKAREDVLIQLKAVALAEKRVRSTDMFLKAGRAQIRDVLESQEALLNAQNALTAAIVDYRVTELVLQRDLGLLEVSGNGLWKEYIPGETPK